MKKFVLPLFVCAALILSNFNLCVCGVGQCIAGDTVALNNGADPAHVQCETETATNATVDELTVSSSAIEVVDALNKVYSDNCVPVDGQHEYRLKYVKGSCTQKGCVTHTCAICGDSFSDNYTQLEEHNFSEWTVAPGGAPSGDDLHTRTCSVCGKTESEEIPAGLQYTISNGKATITGYTGSAAVLAVPDTIDGAPVTVIKGYSFKNNTVITDMVLPDRILTIGEQAFFGCSALKQINLPWGLTSIGNYAFYSCSSLKSISIPDSVVTIGDYAFRSCSGLSALALGKGLTKIGCFTFSGCSMLAKIVLPDNIKSIDGNAFLACTSLSTVTIPNAVTNIAKSAFAHCTGLKQIIIPGSIKSIEDSVFYNCTRLADVYYIGTAAQWANISISITDNSKLLNANLHYCSDWTVRTPASCTQTGIKYTVCNDCSAEVTEDIPVASHEFTDTVIPPTCTTEGYTVHTCTACEYAYTDSYTAATGHSMSSWFFIAEPTDFEQGIYCRICSSCGKKELEIAVPLLQYGISDGEAIITKYTGSSTVLTIPETIDGCPVTAIDGYAFKNCTTLTEINLPSGILTIGDQAFYGCSALSKINIPDGVTAIGNHAFYDCSLLKSISIPDSVTSLGDYTFRRCLNLSEIILGKGITAIGYFTVSGCSALTSIIIPEGVTTIGENAFHSSALKSVTIPDSVTTVKNNAFAYCTKLEDIYYTGTASQWQSINTGDTGNDALTASTVHYVKADLQNGVTVENANGEEFDNPVQLVVIPLDAKNDISSTVTSQFNEMKFKAYDISLISNGVTVQPGVAVTVSMKLPTGYDSSICKVFRVEADDSLTDMNAAYNNGSMIFTTDHFSQYILGEYVGSIPGDLNGDGAVDIRDLVHLKKMLAEENEKGDINNDGKVNTGDLIVMRKYLLGILAEIA